MLKYTPGDAATERPQKPKHVKDFPLWPDPLGYWVKKIRGRVERFGRWGKVKGGQLVYLPYEDGWQAALKDFRARYDSASGTLRDAAPAAGTVLLKDLCNAYLAALEDRVGAKSRSITRGYFLDQKAACARMIQTLGGTTPLSELTPAKFSKLATALQKQYGPNRYANEVVRIKTIFKWGFEQDIVPTIPRWGDLKGPAKAEILLEKDSKAERLFSPEEIRSLLEEANPVMRAAILLGVNCGLGNLDIANLEPHRIKEGWLVYPRGKTGEARRVPLWPETIAALDKAWLLRVAPAKDEDENIILLTDRGQKLVRWAGDVRIDGLMARFRVLLNRVGINRKGVGFYACRHTAATIGVGAGDRDAVKYLMGHSYGDTLSIYDKSTPSDARLQAVTDHIRSSILGSEGGAV